MSREKQREYIMDMIDEATHPDSMPWREAKEFLEDLAEEIKDRAHVLEEENAEE